MLAIRNNLVFSVLSLLAVAPAIFAASVYLLPKLEQMALPPVAHLEFSKFECEEGTLKAHGVLDKRRGEFYGLTVMLLHDQPKRANWHGIDQPANSPDNRPAGQQVISIAIDGACDVPFMIHTEHKAPHGYWILRQSWGPFNGK